MSSAPPLSRTPTSTASPSGASQRCHVLVAGAGPAGLAAAAACKARGLDVRVVAPSPQDPWERQLACWDVELPTWVPPQWVRTRWPQVRVAGFDEATVARPYVALDVPAVQRDLLARLGPSVTRGRLNELVPTARGVAARLDGETVEADVVIDARGAGSPGRSWQSAFGLEVTLSRPWTRGAWLMDFRAAEPRSLGLSPTFAYVLPFDAHRVLFEETVLMGNDSVDVLARLERRLHARLAGWGVQVAEVHRTERCRIPMDAVPAPVPSALRGRVVRFGAAAGMTHPATGYQLGMALRRTDPLADAVARVVRGGPAALDSAVWPEDAVAAHALHRFGASALQDLDAGSTAAFFDAFFALPPEQSVGYLARTLTVQELRAAMWSLFCRASWRTRVQQQRAALRDPAGALRGVFTGAIEKAA